MPPYELIPALLSIIGALQSAPQVPATGPQQPTRDRPGLTAPAAHGTIRGRVTDFNTGEGVPRALVRLTGSVSVATHTRPDGSFQFDELAAGVYYIDVTRAGYLNDRGYARAGRRAFNPIKLAPDRTDADVAVQLIRSSVIGGQITDEFGEPVPGVSVRAGRTFFRDGRRQVLAIGNPYQGGWQTDDEGRFRIGDLQPGRYYVWAIPRNEVQAEAIVGETPMQYVTTFAPGTREPEAAAVIEVGRGERSLGVNITLARGRPSTVSGVATTPQGTPLAGAAVMLETYENGVDFSSSGSQGWGKTDAQGGFVIRNVPPGTYMLAAHAATEPGALLAQMPLEVRDADITGLTLHQAVLKLKIRFTTDGADGGRGVSPVPVVTLVPDGPGPPIYQSGPLEGDRISIDNVPAGRYWPKVMSPYMHVRAVLLDGTDLTDGPIELREGVSEAQLTIVISSRMATVTGTVVESDGRPSMSAVVLVFRYKAGVVAPAGDETCRDAGNGP